MNKLFFFSILLFFLLLSGCFTPPEEMAKIIQEQERVNELSIELKKEVFFELVKLQDSINDNDPEYNKKSQEAYSIIGEKYGLSENEVQFIATEGILNDWPMPSLLESET